MTTNKNTPGNTLAEKLMNTSPILGIFAAACILGLEVLKHWIILNLIISGIHFNSKCNGGFTNVISNEWFCGRQPQQTEMTQ